MREAERQSAAAALGDRVPRLVDVWSSVCPDDELDRGDAETVVRAVIGSLVVPIDVGPLAETVIGSGIPLDQCVHRLGLLRRVLYDEVLATVPFPAARDIAHAVDSAIDAVLEATVARMASDLAEAALIDPLTGMPNRRALEQDLARDLANADRAGQELTVVMVDLDGLKQRNDSDGHAAGDAALRALAVALQAGLRAGDGAYRLGGDEFVLLLPGAAAGDADLVMARVRGSRPPAFSWGAATFPSEGRDAAALLGLADERLYSGRRQRRRGGGATSAGAAVAATAVSSVRRRRNRRHGVRMAALCIRLASFAVPAAALAVLATTHGRGAHSPPAALAPAGPRPGHGTGSGVTAAGRAGPSTAPSLAPPRPHPPTAPPLAPSGIMPPALLAAAHPAAGGPSPVTVPPAGSATPPRPRPVSPPVTGPAPVPAPTPPPTPRPDRDEPDHRRERHHDEPHRGEDGRSGGQNGAPYRQVERGP